MVWAVSLFTTDLITRRVPVIKLVGIRSLHRIGKPLWTPWPKQCSTPDSQLHEALPK